mgnify:CR=1 FL=1
MCGKGSRKEPDRFCTGMADCQEEKAAAVCVVCGGEIYDRDEAYHIGGDWIHLYCLGEFAEEFFQDNICSVKERGEEEW